MTDRLAEVADLAVERERKRKQTSATDQLSHHDRALLWLKSRERDGHRPVFAGGTFYTPGAGGLWESVSHERVQVEVAEQGNGAKGCARGTDYRQIAAHASAVVEDDEFFAGAPVGVVTPRGFWRLDEHGRCAMTELGLEHRQQFALAWDPDFEAEAPRVDALLASAFEGDDDEAQVDLVWQLIGATLFGVLPMHQVVALLIGKERSGKSTLQRLIESAFPSHAVSAVPPIAWGREYYVAGLANKRLNSVGELAEDALPAASFKNVTGLNLIAGRHPTHRPFYFTCNASHWFASNSLPATTDRTEGFFRRWRVVHFRNRVADDQVDPRLVDKILADEMPGFLASAFRGVERVVAAGGVRTTGPHERIMAKWRSAANPVLQFLTDEEWVSLDPAAAPVPTRAVFAAYRRWAASVGSRHAFGRNHFLELLDTTGAGHGVLLTRTESGPCVRGLELIDRRPTDEP